MGAVSGDGIGIEREVRGPELMENPAATALRRASALFETLDPTTETVGVRSLQLYDGTSIEIEKLRGNYKFRLRFSEHIDGYISFSVDHGGAENLNVPPYPLLDWSMMHDENPETGRKLFSELSIRGFERSFADLSLSLVNWAGQIIYSGEFKELPSDLLKEIKYLQRDLGMWLPK